ncbi:hypothetical protein TRFO_11493 [Tritrichomonas foetus]|uniref:Protein kinase domain-containing protein n=1 Tax=Tritrichomonas foetus TaxID=1144522 RepID=A0A1J4J997_9EUKA|nr:hypothetical protein TRFO_11493 [Tritrichomonas foetus]|eukprot:OHS93997.1 hypothetical protein TRFO_11493 [Tritrichomonas foetus]
MKSIDKSDFSIDLNDFDILCELSELHCGISYCLKHKTEGFLANLILLTKVNFTEATYQQFIKEVKSISNLDHPCLVRFLGLSGPHPVFDNKIGILYEYLPKCFTLSCIIDEIDNEKGEPPLEKEQVLMVIYGLSNALTYLHKKDITCMNLNALNILLDDTFSPRIQFYGISILGVSINRLNDYNTILYIPPEVLNGQAHDKKGDVYAFAYILLRLWANDKFYTGKPDVNYTSNIKNGNRLMISPNTPIIIRMIIMKCWDQTPINRPNFSEINWIIGEIAEFIFDDVVNFNSFLEFKKNLPIFKKVVNPQSLRICEKSLFDATTQLSISKKGRNFVQNVIKLQVLIMNLSFSNLQITKNLILSSDFALTKDGVYSIATNIAVAATSRFKNILLYSKLVSELYLCRSSFPFIGYLKKYLLSFFITSLANYCAYPNSLPIVALVCFCLQQCVYEQEEIVKTISEFYERYKSEKKISVNILFCWFCPEIEEVNQPLFDKMLELVKSQCQYNFHPNAFKIFLEQLDSNRADNWSLYKRKRLDKNLTSFSYALRIDDIERIRQDFQENPSILNCKIEQDIFVPCTFAHDFPTCLMYAAVFGAIKCFLFFLKNGAKVGYWDRKYRQIPMYSIAGGDENIFYYSLQNYKDYDSLLQTAAQFHQYQLFLKSNVLNKNLMKQMDRYGKSVMSSAAGSNNLSILIYCFVQNKQCFIESFGRTPLHVAAEHEMCDVLKLLLFLSVGNDGVVDANARDSWGMTPLHLAADKLKRKACKILLASPKIDVNLKNFSGKTAVYYAVKTGDLKLINIFLRNPKVDFDCQTKKGETPLHTAVKMRRHDIVALILSYGRVSIHVCDQSTMTPFEYAAFLNDQKTLEIFHEYMKKTNDKIEKPLHVQIAEPIQKTIKTQLQKTLKNSSQQNQNQQLSQQTQKIIQQNSQQQQQQQQTQQQESECCIS